MKNHAALLALLGSLAAVLPAADRAESLREILDVERAFNRHCLDHGRAAGWLEFIADGAYLMNRATVGREEARASLAQDPAGISLTWEPAFADASLSGDLGYSWGEWRSEGPGPDGKPAKRRGIYMTVWRRQPDGRWKFVFDGGRPLPDDALDGILRTAHDRQTADYAVAAPAPADPALMKAGLLRLDAEFSEDAGRRGTMEAFLSHMADEALLLDRGVRTKAAAAAVMAKEPRDNQLSWQPFFADVSAAGDLAYVLGEWRTRAPGADGKPADIAGIYSAIWKRQPDGAWKFVFDNGRPYTPEQIARLRTRIAAGK